METISELKPPFGGVRLSNSTMDVINKCERFFQIEKLLDGTPIRDETEHTIFGSAYGIGAASYLEYQDRDRALYETWMAYYPVLESEKKSEMGCLNALVSAFDRLDEVLEEYELVFFEGKPATELSFCILTGSKYYFVGYIDAVLRHKFSGKYLVIDFKTTGLNLTDLTPLYKNSAQLIGYSIILDAIVGEDYAEYEVGYEVMRIGKKLLSTPDSYYFKKTLSDRLDWFLALSMDIERLSRMEELEFYPKRGTSCLSFNRPCKYLDICGLSTINIPKPDEQDEKEYQFYFNLDSLIETHINRINR